jgi:hypothetical protein
MRHAIAREASRCTTYMQGLLDDNFEVAELYFIMTQELLVQLQHVSLLTSHGIRYYFLLTHGGISVPV